jgi:hypothetical protein
MNETPATLYQIADEEIRKCIQAYLTLTKASKGLSNVTPDMVQDERTRAILLAGLGLRGVLLSATDACEECRRRRALPFDLEAGITTGVYVNIRACGMRFLQCVEKLTDGFRRFDPAFIQTNPHLLPLLQHLAGVFSKAALKREIGRVSDTAISKPAAERLAQMLQSRVDPSKVNKGEVLQRLESTLEGIVRDLVGRVLLESIVEMALKDRGLPFKREQEYDSLPGVVYDFRADFVVPHETEPKAFIEVRKSSSRHASLYAKDKMFSAINWKGRNRQLLAVLVVDGEWTGETLRVMAKVFDYVVPMQRVSDLVDTLDAYLKGDKSKLKWLIEFKIAEARTTEP